MNSGFWLTWILSGILAYGILKNNFRSAIVYGRQVTNYPSSGGYDLTAEFICWVFGLLGYLGIIFALIFTVLSYHSFGLPFGLCYHMPKELSKPRRS